MISKVSSLIVFTAILLSCQAMQQGVDMISERGKDAEAIVKTAKILRNSFADITEEEEYYIGRAVSALILSRYTVYENRSLTSYINIVGNAVAVHSDRPETYAGYHFLILDTEEVNALAAPGGFVFITKGLLKRCRNEEMLASILAHEVGHVNAKHGLQSIKKSRLLDAFGIIGQEAVQRFGPEELAQLTNVFEDVLGDIAENLIERGYDRKYEYEADRLSVQIDLKTGYNPNGLLDFLATMTGDSSQESGKGWFKTHPSAAQRMNSIKKEISAIKNIPEVGSARTERFKQAMRALK